MLEPRHKRALREYSAIYGRRWKARLLTDWERGLPYHADLIDLRNRIGPSGLLRLRPADISK